MKQYLKVIIGLLISGIIFYFIFTLIPFDKLKESFLKPWQNNYYLYMIPGILVYLLSHFANTLRWQHILVANDYKKLPFFSLYKIIAMGFMMNNLPAKLGEPSKVYFLNRRRHVPLGVAIATIVSERFFDLFIVVFIVVISFFILDLSIGIDKVSQKLGFNLVYAMYIVTGILITAIIFILIFRKNYNKMVTLLQKILYWLPNDHTLFEKFRDLFSQLKFFTHPKQLVEILIYSMLVWFIYAMSFYFFIKAYQIDIPFMGILFVLGISALAVAIPGGPAGIGLFETMFAGALLLVGGTDFNVAFSCAFVLHVFQIISISSIGLYFFIKENVSLKDLTKKEMPEV